MTAEHGHEAHEGHDHGHGHGSPFIQHHYDDAQHQFDSGKLGIWIFLAQEVLFFSALFVAYILYRHHHPEIFGYAHKYLDVKYGAINTAVLIFSSLTAAWAVRAAQLGQKKLLIGCIVTTIACACTFLGIKYLEYAHKYHEGLLMGKYFDPCISSGEVPLLTKSNHCPGHQGSVMWDVEAAKPIVGCYPEFAIDREPDHAGLQLACQVSEAKVELEREPKKDDKGNPVKDNAGEPVLVPATDLLGRPKLELTSPTAIAEQCPAPSPHGEGEGEGHGHGGAACWAAAPQPHVCRPGWYYTVRCAPGSACAAELGESAYSPRYDKEDDCATFRGQLASKLKERGEADQKVGKPAFGAEVSATCVRSDSVGFVVDHHDHAHRDHHVLAVATCKAPTPATPTGDPFAEPPRSTAPEFGKKAIQPSHELSAHEQHEALYLGPPPDNTNMFFTIYFAMTGLHGIHVFVGILVFLWLLIRAVKGHFTPEYFGPIDFAALYWHIVDLIWIFLFPLLYLIH